MSILTRFAAVASCAVVITIGAAVPVAAQAQSLAIATTFGPNADLPDPRAGYNGWMSNQLGCFNAVFLLDR